jgi:hypothetical protein
MGMRYPNDSRTRKMEGQDKGKSKARRVRTPPHPCTVIDMMGHWTVRNKISCPRPDSDAGTGQRYAIEESERENDHIDEPTSHFVGSPRANSRNRGRASEKCAIAAKKTKITRGGRSEVMTRTSPFEDRTPLFENKRGQYAPVANPPANPKWQKRISKHSKHKNRETKAHR